MKREDTRTIVVDGATISYLEQGTGPALVLLHGIGSGARSWRAQLAVLSDAYRVIAWDAPGYGSSTPLSMPTPSAGDYAARLALLLRALRVEELHLLGHSLGAIMAARFAAERPDRVISLTLASPSTGHARLAAAEREQLRTGRLNDLATLGPRGMAQKRGPRLLSDDASPEQVLEVVETMARVLPSGYRQAVEMLSGADTEADLVRLPPKMRVQFIYGAVDRITLPQSINDLAAKRPGSSTHVIPAAGHAVYIERSSEFNARIRDFAR